MVHRRHLLGLLAVSFAGVGAARAQARSYLVFFDFDKASLSDRATQIIGEAARNWNGHMRVYVNGYTDTNSGPEYGVRISRARAETVAAELVQLGLPSTAISVKSFGTANQAVPTGPDVIEPQNRRVEIVFVPR